MSDEQAGDPESGTRGTDWLAQRISSEFFGALFESAHDALVIADSEARILEVNGRVESLFGYARKELLGEPMELLLPERSQSPHRGYRGAFVNDRGTRPIGADLDLVALHKDGSEFPVDVSLSPLQSEIGLLVLNSIRDVSARRREEDETQRANAAKTLFLSRVSHELRTPLNAILGFGQLLEFEAGENARIADGVTQILKAGRHLLGMVDSLLDISRIEAAEISLSVEPLAVAGVVTDAVELMTPLADERGVSLVCDLDDAGSMHVIADRRRLAQILLNLLSNAIKYSPDASTVVIATRRESPEHVRLSVRDSGPGIPPELVGRLFVPFDRLGEADPERSGVGLGLALSSGLATAMNGRLGVDTVQGEGATFWVELDYSDEPSAVYPPEVFASATTLLTVSHRERPLSVLHIEDNVSNLRLIERILGRSANVRLVSTIQGRLGLDLAREHVPDVIVLDLHLPDIPGREVLRRLRLDPLTSDIPVVVVSADATSGQIRRILAEGAAAYLTKPIDVKQFVATIEQVTGSGAPE